MAEHRPTDTLLNLIQKALTDAPEGLAPRQILERLVQLGEDVSRPTLNRLLASGARDGLWASHGGGRSIIYTIGQTIGQTIPTSLHSDTPLMPASKNSIAITQDTVVDVVAKTITKAKREKAPKDNKPVSLFQQVRAVVWWIADTLRDRTNLQVESYQPVTLALMALKRNLDTQSEQMRPDRELGALLARQIPMIKGGLRDPKDTMRELNNIYGFWDSSLIQGDHYAIPLMTWADLANFQDSETEGRREKPYVMVLRANPPGHQTEETALFTYTTYAPDLKSFILEIISLMVPILREAFGAIGIHGVLGAQSEHAAVLSNSILRELCTAQGTGQTARLADFDLGIEAVSVDIFSDTYMDLIGRFAEASGKRGGEYFTPTALAIKALLFTPMKKFAHKMSEDPSFVLRIADPTAGSNTFLLKAYKYLCEVATKYGLPQPTANQFAFFAQELKNTQVGLGIFNMFYHGLAERLNLEEDEIHVGRDREATGVIQRIAGNTISEYTNKIGKQSNKIHLIGANPPYGVADYGIAHALEARNDPADNRWTSGVPTRSEGEWSFIHSIVDLLAPTGFAVIVLPLGVLFRDGGSDYRDALIEKDWIEGVIALPANQFLTTSIPVCLMLVNKDKAPEARDGVFFINASEDFIKVGKFNDWQVEKSLAAWNERSEIPGYCGFVSKARLQSAAKKSMAVNRWFSPIKEKDVLDPAAMAQDLAALRQTMAIRSSWLDGVFSQAGALHFQNAQERGAESDDEQGASS